MKTFLKIASVLTAVALFGTTSAHGQDAHAGHSHGEQAHSHGATGQAEKGPNGGSIQMVGQNKVETVLMEKGIMFLVYNAQGQVVQAPSATGKLTLKIGDNPKTYEYKLVGLQNNAIGVAVDLSKVEGHMLHMDVELQGLAAQPISFHAMGKLGGGLSDAMLVSLQKTCPVSGQPLGSMGTPPKVMLGDKPLFVCCAGCTAKVKASPDTYLTKYYGAQGKQIRPGVFEATLADATAIAAQKKCPVMDEELGGMGAPQKVNVKGKAIYICCAGCAKKLAAEPDKYLAMVAKSGVTPPNFR